MTHANLPPTFLPLFPLPSELGDDIPQFCIGGCGVVAGFRDPPGTRFSAPDLYPAGHSSGSGGMGRKVSSGENQCWVEWPRCAKQNDQVNKLLIMERKWC